MEAIINKTKQFVEEIKETDVYKHYKDLEIQLNDKPELMAQVDAFRLKSFDIQISHRYGHFNSYEQIIALKHENEELISDPLVKAFLDAELALTKLLAVIYEAVAKGIEFDTEFLMKK